MKFINEHIKSFIVIILSIVIVFFGYDYFTVTKPQPPPPSNIQPAQTKELSGIVIQYGSNPSGDIDKLLMEENNVQTWLHFPPHTAKKVLSVAKLHAQIKITIAAMPGKNEVINNELQTIISNNNEPLNIRDIPPPPPTQGNEIVIGGNNHIIKTSDDGRANAFILSGKLIALPPHASETLLPLINNAKIILVKGYERSNSDGFVNINNLNLIKPYSIMIDSINYLVR